MYWNYLWKLFAITRNNFSFFLREFWPQHSVNALNKFSFVTTKFLRFTMLQLNLFCLDHKNNKIDNRHARLVNIIPTALIDSGAKNERLCHLLLYRLWKDIFCPLACPLDFSRLGRSVGRLNRCTTAFCSRWRSSMIFLQMSLRVLAMCRAGVSQRNTWHMCFLVVLSRATYAKSLYKWMAHQIYILNLHEIWRFKLQRIKVLHIFANNFSSMYPYNHT